METAPVAPGVFAVSIMGKLLSTFGFLAGIAILAAAFLNPPSVGSLQAAEDSAGCRSMEVPVDEGYGISSVEVRRICGRLVR